MTDKERIEVYVNKLPKAPEECPCQCDTFCNLHCVNEYGQKNYSSKNCFEDMKDCPLKTIQSIQNAKAVEALHKVSKFAEKQINECNKLVQEETEDDYYIQAVNARQSMCFEFRREINQLIKELGGKE